MYDEMYRNQQVRNVCKPTSMYDEMYKNQQVCMMKCIKTNKYV